MNDEIKKILDFKENADYKKLSCDETVILRDYITNLQQENQELNKENEKWWAIIKDDEQEIKDLCLENSKLEQENEQLKTRIEKADWWLREMLRQAKSDETKAIINGTLELLLNGRSDDNE